MSEGQPTSDHMPQGEQPPESVEERGGAGGEEEEVEEVIAQPSASLSIISPPAVSVPHLRSPRKAVKKRAVRRKKNSLNARQRSFAERRLELLKESFIAVPFSRGKALDISAHEELFHALGLWEFYQLDLGGELRPDLLAHLIAYYDHSLHRSYVDGTRISVKRIDLARAMRLPTKKEKADVSMGRVSIKDLVSADGATTVLLDFMSNYMLFEEDMCILPAEVIQAIQFVKEGAANMVDWASVMWVLVEKELLEAPKTRNCFYASHLQLLIKLQQPSLLSKRIEPVLPPDPEIEEEVSAAHEVNVSDVEINAAGELPLAEEEVNIDTRKMRSLEDLAKVASERHKSDFGLTLGESVMNAFEDCKLDDENRWFEESKNEGFGHCMRHCSSKAFDSIDFENLTKADGQEKQEERFANDLSVKFTNMEMMTSSDHIEMENCLNPSSGVLLDRCPNPHKDIVLDHGSSDSLYFGNNGKRKVDEILQDEELLFNQKNHLKVMRSCEPWGNLHSFSFGECIDQINCGLKRANALFSEKDRRVVSMEMEVQYLNQLVQEKDQVIQSLKLAMEGQQNWQMESRQYEVELCLLSQMMLGYKRALKETRSRFADYRKMHPHDEESLYKDVHGEGGLVLSAREFEKYQSMQEENKRQELLGSFCNLKEILNKLEECEGRIIMHDSKLGKLVGEMNQLKEVLVRSNSSEK